LATWSSTRLRLMVGFACVAMVFSEKGPRAYPLKSASALYVST
jgi:hypothetical protein